MQHGDEAVRLTLGQPLTRRRPLALRTVAVTAAVVGDLDRRIALASQHVPAERGSAILLEPLAEQHLDHADILVVLHQLGCEGMAQPMK